MLLPTMLPHLLPLPDHAFDDGTSSFNGIGPFAAVCSGAQYIIFALVPLQLLLQLLNARV